MLPPFVDDELRYEWLTTADLPHLVAMLAKPEVCAHVYFGPNTPEQTWAYFGPQVAAMRSALARGARPEEHLFAIRERSSGAWIGECALAPVGFGAGNYTIGYQLDVPYWRRGHGARACRFLVWYGFAVLGAHRLSGDTLTSNAGSIAVMERCGLRPEGIQRRYYHTRGAYHDNALFGLLREDAADRIEAYGATIRAEAADADGRGV
ncbi:MAG: GNAT family protein [Nannocystaceae bacterium]